MRRWFIIPIALSGLIFFTLGCVGYSREGGDSVAGNTPPLSDKKQKEGKEVPKDADDAGKYMPGQVLVKLKPGVEKTFLETIAEELGLETIQALALPGTYLMKITGDESIDGMVEKLKMYDAIEYAEPNYSVKVQPERSK